MLPSLNILAHYRVNIRNKHDGRLLYKVLKCWGNEFARYQLQFTLAMSTNSFEAGEDGDAIEASQISTFDCDGCKRYFKTKRGLTLHRKSWKWNPRNREQSVTSTIDVSHDDQNILVTDMVSKWRDIDRTTFIERVEIIYEKVVYWKKN